VHGFRSSFRDWATEHDKVREVVAEAALAHSVKDKTEAAYRRAAYLDERRDLMQRCASYCNKPFPKERKTPDSFVDEEKSQVVIVVHPIS
jgi:hypothetical protein